MKFSESTNPYRIYQRIEFMGLPGSGKSTLAKVLLDEFQRKNLKFFSNDNAVIRCIRRRDDGFLRNTLKKMPFRIWEPIAGIRNALEELHEFSSSNVSFFHFIYEVLNRNRIPLSWRECILYAFFKKSAENQLFHAYMLPHEGVVVEEGFAMGVITLLGCLPPDSPCSEDVARYVKSIPNPGAVFWVDVEPYECAARLRRRPEPPLFWKDCSNPELLDQLEYNHRCLLDAFDELQSLNIPVCRVPNSLENRSKAQQTVRQVGIRWKERTPSQ